MASNPIEHFYLLPNFVQGFTYFWYIDPVFADPFPWKFVVEEAKVPAGPFVAISPELTVYRYQETGPRLISPDNNLYFRLKFITGNGTYYSPAISPHTQIDRSSFLLIREIMRKEMLRQRNLSGVVADVYIRASFGPYCDCIDPITKDIITSQCPKCFGVGRTPGYHGPYLTWVTFEAVQKAKGLQDDNTAPKQAFKTAGRIISVPELKTADIIIDKTTDRRFYVDSVQHIMEIRRVPVVSNVVLNLIPVTDSIYKVGQNDAV